MGFFDGLTKPGGFISRVLPSETALRFDLFTPKTWMKKQNIIKDPPPDSGYGYITSPYNSIFNVMWGVYPSADLAKYRLMYRTVPKVKRAVDKTVSFAINKGISGFEFKYPVKDAEAIIEYLEDWIESQDDWKITLQMIASDLLIYGNAYAELVYEEPLTEEQRAIMQHPIDPLDPNSGVPERVFISNEGIDWAGKDMNSNTVPQLVERKLRDKDGNMPNSIIESSGSGNVVWLKVLDPLYMRARVDSYGNCFGFLQWFSSPPVAFTTDKVAHFKYNPKSTAYETVYGTSMLQSLIRTQEAIWQIENDLILIGHTAAKIPLHFDCGTPEAVWTDEAFMKFQMQMKTRGSGADIFTRGDVVANQLAIPAAQISHLMSNLKYHDVQRSVALGVPPALLGEPEGSSRTTAEISLDDFINQLQILQNEIGNVLEEHIFKYILQPVFGKDVAVPNIVWNEIFDKTENDIISRIVSLRSSGLISFNEGRRMLEDLGYKLDDLGAEGDIIPELMVMQASKEAMDDPGTSPMADGQLMYPEIVKKKKVIKKGSVKK